MMATATAPGADLKLLSSIPGRQRWLAPGLKERPRLAAAVEEALRRDAPTVARRASPITGRVPLDGRPVDAPVSSQHLVARAMRASPLTEAALIALRGNPDI